MTDGLLKRLERFGEKPGLERIRFLLNALGNPEDSFPAVHVAGTNGKGSTASMIASILQAAGMRVGLFTSPHLIRYNERIVVDGRPISDEDLDQIMAELEVLVQQAAEAPGVGQPTEFEVGTAAAITYFARARVDVAVVEVGLGGRFDSTNVVRPVASVITPIALDHTNRLGNTLAAIAADKAGIIRPGVPVISAVQRRDAANVIAAEASARGAPLVVADRDFEGKLIAADKHGTTFDVRWKGEWIRGLRVPLLGQHQVVNGATVVAACLALRDAQDVALREAQEVAPREAQDLALRDAQEVAPREAQEVAPREVRDLTPREAQDVTLRDVRDVALRDAQDVALREAQEVAPREAQDLALRDAQDVALREAQDVTLRDVQDPAGLSLTARLQALSADVIRAGLRDVEWPGRLEVMGDAPTVILDGAHNAQAAEALAASLRTVFPAERPVFVIGILEEKPIDRILQTLLPLGRAVVFTKPRSSRTPAADPAELARRAVGAIETIAVEPEAEHALARARALAGSDGVVCICGSLYLVGELRRFLAGER